MTQTETTKQFVEAISSGELAKKLSTNEIDSTEFLSRIQEYLNGLQYLSPNEPMTEQGVVRILQQLNWVIVALNQLVGSGKNTITLWNANSRYNENDIVLYFKEESKQVTDYIGKRTFAFLLVSMKDGNTSIPNYDLVDGIPSFKKTNWQLLNPLSYLLQDLPGLSAIFKEVFQGLIAKHVSEEHCVFGSGKIEDNLVRKDYGNLSTETKTGVYSLNILDDGSKTKSSNGILEYRLKYSFDEKANPLSDGVKIASKRYYLQRSPIMDESDQYIFAQKYTETDLFSVAVNKRKVWNALGTQQVDAYTNFNNLRYGTNIFHARIDFPEPFMNAEYCVFFDTHDSDAFVFGYDKEDIQSKTEPTYDAVVSMPMLLNKSASGFDIVLPIHTYFNSIQKFQIGVPWKNEFRLQAIGRYSG